jgi:hypothetical protein
MFLLDKINNFGSRYKKVNYFGIDFYVAEEVEYIATNKDGQIYGYVDVDLPIEGINEWRARAVAPYYLGNCSYTGYWQWSLMIVD